jgi:hypothetical protein
MGLLLGSIDWDNDSSMKGCFWGMRIHWDSHCGIEPDSCFVKEVLLNPKGVRKVTSFLTMPVIDWQPKEGRC